MNNTKLTNLLKYINLVALIILSVVALYIIGVIATQISLFVLGVLLLSEIVIVYTSWECFSLFRDIYNKKK